MQNDLNILIKNLLKNIPKQYKNIVLECINLMQKFHTEHNRLSGENYIFHALRVANITADFNLDVNSILVSILHSVLYKVEGKEQEKFLKEIGKQFGEEVIYLLEILENINQGTDSDETDREIITKFILSNSDDIRAILIKLADVLDDSHSMEFLTNENIKLKCDKIFNIYSPLASYLNLETVRKELDEIAFKFTKPEDYRIIEEKMLNEGLTDELLSKYIIYLESLVVDILDYNPKIFGRIKSKFSVYRKLKKLENEGVKTSLSNIDDRLALTIITQKEEDCFLLKMFLEEHGSMEESKTDDYISNPKPNGFQALQFSILFPQIHNVFIEIQVLTYRMYYINTYGPASHLAYKASKTRFAKPSDSFNWVKQLHDKITRSKHLRKQSRNVPLKADIFKNNIYVFTPKGQIIELINGASALDFAYRVHTMVGHKAMFVNVNNVRQNLDIALQTGDVVEVLLSKENKYPNRDWLKFVKTDSAIEKIKKSLKKKTIF